jgi:hypothetical protein
MHVVDVIGEGRSRLDDIASRGFHFVASWSVKTSGKSLY